MVIGYSKSFIKQAKKLQPNQRQKLQAALATFADNPLHPSLRNHALKGRYKGYRSIDVAADLRALYLQKDNESVFDAVGTHSQLYG